ncbi:MAG: type II toxin-antitoxin system RelE/ParE family toxin [Pseudomonadota bacterium]
MTLTWSDRAIRQLTEIVAYISAENVEAARRVAERIVSLAETLLPEQPLIGRPGRVQGTRELVVTQTPYVLAYHIKSNEITVVAVIHAARRWPSSL